MSDILMRILARKHQEVISRKLAVSQAQLIEICNDMPDPRRFVAAMRHKIAEGKPAVIAFDLRADPATGELYPIPADLKRRIPQLK